MAYNKATAHRFNHGLPKQYSARRTVGVHGRDYSRYREWYNCKINRTIIRRSDFKPSTNYWGNAIMGLGKTIAYMGLWAVGFISARALLTQPMNFVESTIGGTSNRGA